MSAGRDALRYVIRADKRQGGVTLSLRGQWGNLRYRSYDDARAAAVSDAGSSPMTVEREGC